MYQRNLKLSDSEKLPDPINTCGTPAGFPRLMNVPDTYEFVVRPEQTWILTENGPNVMRIYTDGRAHPALEDRWGTYTGDSVGHWEGDTLVFDTVSTRMSNYPESGDTVLDRTGLILSDARARRDTPAQARRHDARGAHGDRRLQSADRAVERDQDVPKAAQGHARLRLCVRGKQPESRQHRDRRDADSGA